MNDILYQFAAYCVGAICLIIFAIGIIQVFIYFIQLVIAVFVFVTNPNNNRLLLDAYRNEGALPPITIIIPAYNESVTIIDSINSMLVSDYPNAEMIVVNDGSTDDTLAIIDRYFDLAPIPYENQVGQIHALPHQRIRQVYVSLKDSRLRIIDKENGGKADAHNAGINLSQAPILCLLDADSILASDALSKGVMPFIDDPKTIAVGGSIRVANGSSVHNGVVQEIRLSKNKLVLFQTVEYMRTFFMARVAWGRLDALINISGAFGLFSREHLINIGGFTVGSIGEDFDLTIKLHKYICDSNCGYNIKFVADATCWTQVPESIGVLDKQRTRWQIGAIQTFYNFSRLAFRRKYKRVGRLLLPYVILADIIGPLAEILGYLLMPLFLYFDILTVQSFISYVALIFSYNIFSSTAAIAMEGRVIPGLRKNRYLFVLFIIGILENFGYRQLCLYWRAKGIWKFMTGKISWGKMERVRFNKNDKNAV
jgi:cellulose synthase/poly-beta-1,6-N-acetylglucosamine synthase-like glycosyltransferase